MQENYELVRLPALNKNSQVYLGVERKPGKVKQSVLFARSVAHDVYLLGDAGRATRSLSRALDQLDRSMLPWEACHQTTPLPPVAPPS